MQKFKVNGESVPKIEWKQTDGRMDGGDCITCRINAVGKRHMSKLVKLFVRAICSMCMAQFFADNMLCIVMYNVFPVVWMMHVFTLFMVQHSEYCNIPQSVLGPVLQADAVYSPSGKTTQLNTDK